MTASESRPFVQSGSGRQRGRCRLAALLFILIWSTFGGWLSTPGIAVAQEIDYFQIATGASGASAFAVGRALAKALSNPPGSVPCEDGGSCGVPGMVAVALSTQGSIDNIERLVKGQVDAALVDADILYWAYHGTGLFDGQPPRKQLRAVGNLYSSILHIVVVADSGIQSPADLVGRRVAVGEPDSGTYMVAQVVLRGFGVAFADLGLLEIRPGPASDLLARGGADAFLVAGGVPVTAVSELAKRIAIRLLPVDGTIGEELVAFQPFLTRAAIPPDRYKGVPRTVSVGVGVQLVVTSEVDEDRIAALTKALWNERNLALFDTGPVDLARPILDQARSGIAIPLHAGAQQFYDNLDAPEPASE